MNNPFLLTTGNIDWSSRPDRKVVRYFYMGPDGPVPIPDKLLSDHAKNGNAQMIHADIYGTAEERFRNCRSIGCGKAFKFQFADDFTCPDCRQERAEMERRQGVEGDLLNANGRIKP